MSKPLRVAYGAADFAHIRNGGYWWRDNSAFLQHVLEDGAQHQMLLRPPGFGKTVFASMLRCYVDIHEKRNFKKLFDGTAIAKMGENPAYGHNILLDWASMGILRFAVDVRGHAQANVI